MPRPSVEAPGVLTFGPFRVDRVGGVLSRDGQELPLPPKAFGVLVCLLQRPGALVSREHLFREVWDGAAVTNASLTEAVRTLRQALDDDPQQPRYVQTVHRRGYRFVAEVRREEGEAASLGRAIDDGERQATRPVSRSRITTIASHTITAGLAVAAGLLIATAGIAEPERPLNVGSGPDMYVAELFSDAIVRFDGADGTHLGTFARGDRRSGPAWMACAPNGNLIVTRPQTREVMAFDGTTGARLGTFASTNLTAPRGLTVGGSNDNIFVSNLEPDRNIVELDGRTGEFVRTFASIDPGQPMGMAFGPNGNLFVAVTRTPNWMGGRVEELDGMNGALVRRYDTPVEARDVVFGPNDTFFVTADSNVLEFEIGRQGPARTLASHLNTPQALRFGPNGNLFVVNSGAANIVEFDVATAALVRNLATIGLSHPIGLLFGTTSSGPCGPG